MTKRDEVIMRRRNGATHSKISKATGVPMGTISHWLATAGLTTPNLWDPDKLADLRYVLELRRREGLSHSKIGKLVEVSASTVQRWLLLYGTESDQNPISGLG